MTQLSSLQICPMEAYFKFVHLPWTQWLVKVLQDILCLFNLVFQFGVQLSTLFCSSSYQDPGDRQLSSVSPLDCHLIWSLWSPQYDSLPRYILELRTIFMACKLFPLPPQGPTVQVLAE